MEIFLKVILPVLIIIAFYLLIRFITKKGAISTDIFIKVRILVGAVASGVFICLAIQGQDLREIFILSGLAAIVFYGVVMLQSKYLSVKK